MLSIGGRPASVALVAYGPHGLEMELREMLRAGGGGILLTQVAWTMGPPAVRGDFWAALGE